MFAFPRLADVGSVDCDRAGNGEHRGVGERDEEAAARSRAARWLEVPAEATAAIAWPGAYSWTPAIDSTGSPTRSQIEREDDGRRLPPQEGAEADAERTPRARRAPRIAEAGVQHGSGGELERHRLRLQPERPRSTTSRARRTRPRASRRSRRRSSFAATTRSRTGVDEEGVRDRPVRVLAAESTMPTISARSRRDRRELATIERCSLTPASWSCEVEAIRVEVTNHREPERSSARARGSRRVVASLRSSARTSRDHADPSDGQREEDLLERRPFRAQLVQDDAGRRGHLADPLRRCRHPQLAVADRRRLDSGLARAARGAARLPERARRCRRRRARSSVSSGSCVTSLPWWMITTSSASCATSASTWLEMKTVPPSAANGAQEVAEPADPLGIEPVRRLVEHQQARLAQQRARDAQPLAHAERVAADPSPRGAAELDLGEHLVHARDRDPGRERRARGGGSVPERVGWKLSRLEHRSDRSAAAPAAAGSGRPSTRASPARRPDEPEQRPQRGRLARAVRAEEARDPPAPAP